MKKLFIILTLQLLSNVQLFPQGNSFPGEAINLNEEIFLTTSPVQRDPKKIYLKWSCSPLESERFFTVERSKEGKVFEVIGVIKGRAGEAVFEFTDELPAVFNNFYRIKAGNSENNFSYSKIISKGISAVQFCRFYPNPVEKHLIIRTESPVELRISDQLNNVRISKKLEIGPQLIDVSTLENGFYIITILQKESNRIITDKLIKR